MVSVDLADRGGFYTPLKLDDFLRVGQDESMSFKPMLETPEMDFEAGESTSGVRPPLFPLYVLSLGFKLR